ncbi:MAG: hypothetical protein QG614_186 [Patescibacteria group bacterium]|nr:hypothetical protein [Patescibacteria group bacterium]
MRRRVDPNINLKEDDNKDKINCPHCGEIVSVNAGSILGKKSGKSRIGASLQMRELVELRWNKAKNKKNNKVSS